LFALFVRLIKIATMLVLCMRLSLPL
jgi:hypothetical protein